MTSESPLVVEPRRRSAKPQVSPKPLPELRPLDTLFLNAYLANGHNGTQAYKAIHPKATMDSCRASASLILSRPQIKAELERRIRQDTKITLELIEQDLLTARELALAQANPQVIASIAMDQAKLKGYLVERRETKDVTATDAPIIRSLVDAALTPTPTLTPPHQGGN